MIKIENDIYYMTAGETCMILKNDGGRLKNVYFGKRVEFEDDLAALGYGALGTEETFTVGGFPFKIVGATVLDKKPSFATGLDGGKTLVVSMRAEGADITAEVFYTPYPRGGFTRRTTVVNNSGKTVSADGCNDTAIGGIEELVWVSADGKIASGRSTDKKARCVENFLAAVQGGGKAYGFLCAYGDGAVCGRSTDEYARIAVKDGASALEQGGEYVSPEMLAVFSDGGIDGMSRALHDILRGGMNPKYLNMRRPIVLFCPEMSEKKTADAAVAAYELGCDVFAVDVGSVTPSALDRTVKACRETGIKPGISVTPERIKQKSAVFHGACVKSDGEFYSLDLGSERCADEFLSKLSELIEKYDLEYLMIDMPRGGLGKSAVGVCRIRRVLAEKFGELFTEWGIAPGDLRDGRSLCYPPCLTRNVVEPKAETSLKTAFDTATIGCLGYKLDPLSVTADVKRALRAQIFSYQDDAPAVMLGDIYRSDSEGCKCTACVTKDKSRAYVVCVTNGGKTRATVRGLDEHNLYNVRELNKTFSGAALMSIGVPVAEGAKTFCLHFRQVADYDQ